MFRNHCVLRVAFRNNHCVEHSSGLNGQTSAVDIVIIYLSMNKQADRHAKAVFVDNIVMRTG